MRVVVSHAHLKQNVSGWELAPTQTHFISDAYGERRDNESAPACESVGMANPPGGLYRKILLCEPLLKRFSTFFAKKQL
ncbi:MAG: hypothetical protein IKJ39_05830 [Lachnospiraceae bacterium]|nr:hypothetical protein [Lachnospiraceae bacterium]